MAFQGFFGIAGLVLVAAGSLEAGTLRGRVVDSGRGVAAATVSAVPYESALDVARREAHGAPAPSAVAMSTTDAGGSFLLKIPTGAVSVQLRVEAPGTVTFRSADVFDGAEIADVGDLGVSKGASVTGRVVDGRGHGVADAAVRLEPAAERGGDHVPEARVARTTADGAFHLDGASSSGNRVSVEKQGFGSTSLAGLRAGTLATPIVLSPAVSVSGLVRRQDGKTPAGGVLVRLEGKARTRWVESAADGTFHVADGAAGPARVVAEAGSAGRAEVATMLPSAAPLTLVLDPATRIAGRVVNAKTLQPIPRVGVVIEGHGSPVIGRAGADGRYVIDGLTPGTYRLVVDAAPFVRYSRPGVRVARGQSRPVDIPLVVGATLSGRVVDEGGKAVAGAVGRLEGASRQRFGPGARRGRNPSGDGGAFTTAADGSFKAERLPPGSNERLALAHADFVPKTVGGIALTPGGTKTGLTVVLHRGLEISGTVRDSEGRALAEVEIQLRPSASEGRAGGRFAFGPGPGRGGEGRQATSGADGRFRVAGLEAGAYTLEAHRDGFADAHIEVVRLDADAVPPAVDVWMLPGATISGFVHRPDGSGAKGFVVRAQAGAAPARPFGGGGRPPDATGDDGAFTIEGLQAGESYTLTVFGGGRGPEEHAGIQAPATNVEFTAGGAGQITGHVVDALTQKPVTAFTATYEADRGSGGAGRGFGGRMGPRGGRPPGGDDAESDDAEPPSTDGSFIIKDVPAGSWTVVVDADAYETARVSGVSVKEGEATPDVEVRVTRGRVLSGRTVDASTGQPIPGVSVTATSAAGGQGGFGQPAAVTDADGHFDLVGLALGTYRVQAQHPDYADASQIVDLQQSAASVEVLLSSGGTLGGVVVSAGGAPLVGASVQIRSGGGGGRFGGGGGGQPSTITDGAGTFHFDRLTAGVYAVSATLGAQTGAPVDVPLLAGQSRQDVRVVIGGGATLRGQVTGLGDSLRGSVNVMANGPDGYFAAARPTADGAFSLSGAPEGTTHVRATAGTPATGTRTASIDVDVGSGQTEAQADIAFTDGFSLSGTITRGGQPVSGVGVSARIAGQGPSGTSLSDDGGNYAIVGLGQGAYSIQASPPRGASRQQTVTMSGDQTLDFVLPPAGIAGVVVEAGSGQPLQGAAVTAQSGDSSGGRGARAVTDSNGAFSIDGLDPQPYALRVNLTDYANDNRTVDAGANGSDALRIELTRGNGLDFTAFNGTYGVPIPLQRVSAEVHDANGAVVFEGPVFPLANGSGTVTLKQGSYSVRFSAVGSGCAPFKLAVNVPSPALNVVLTAGGTVKINTGSTPLPATVHLQDSPFRDLVITIASAQQPAEIDNVSPGTYSLVVEPSGAPHPVIVTEGQTTNVNLQ